MDAGAWGRNIVLIGLMGAGKTTVGRLVAERLGRAFVDTDALVEAAAGKAIREVFADEGEQAFRTLEAQAVAEVSRRQGQVIGVGGGAVCDAVNTSRLQETGDLVLLDADPSILAGRVASAPGERPLLAGQDDAGARLAALRRERDAAYAAAAAHVIDTTDGTPGEVAEAVLAWARTRPGLLIDREAAT